MPSDPISNRRAEFKRNQYLEQLLEEINGDLSFAETRLVGKNIERKYPFLFVVGPLRSGTTLMTQWLTSTGQFACPTNMLSRFYSAPIIGAKIQLLLTDHRYNFRNEIMDFSSRIDYISENGKTKGALSPNEFWYFWRRFIPFDEQELDYLPDDVLFARVDIDTFRSELQGVANVFKKPMVMKALMCNYNIGFLEKVFEKALFIYTKRDPYTNIESVLKARERQHGSENIWYSFKIPEYPELVRITDPIEQTAGQIYYINRAVSSQLDNVADERKIIVDYEEFCEDPGRFYNMIVRKLNVQGFEMPLGYNGPSTFDITRTGVRDKSIVEKYDRFVKRKQLAQAD